MEKAKKSDGEHQEVVDVAIVATSKGIMLEIVQIDNF